jgi:hypothetical protein
MKRVEVDMVRLLLPLSHVERTADIWHERVSPFLWGGIRSLPSRVPRKSPQSDDMGVTLLGRGRVKGSPLDLLRPNSSPFFSLFSTFRGRENEGEEPNPSLSLCSRSSAEDIHSTSSCTDGTERKGAISKRSILQLFRPCRLVSKMGSGNGIVSQEDASL